MKKMISLLVLSAVLFTACKSVDPYTGEQKVSNKTKGAATGAVVGGIIGGIAKGKEGAITGAAVGGLGGLAFGAYLDKQEAELRAELQGTGVSVVKEGDNLRLVLPGNITFASSSSSINDNFKQVLDSIAKVTAKYKKTNLQINGYTDSTGKYDSNMTLSKQRADAVRDYLVFKGVAAGRMLTEGKGPTNFVASNDTKEGKEQNRRVEISFMQVAGETY